MQRIHMLAALGVLALAGLAGVWWGGASPEPPPLEISRDGPEAGEPPVTRLTVHVAGAVRSPGLVNLEQGNRVAHAVAAAGGALPVADLTGLNLAAEVEDGDLVVVPVKGQPAEAGRTEPDDGRPIDLNRATAGELESLRGVGPVLARRILEYRDVHGPFEALEDLLDVPGIGEGKLADLREALVAR